MINLVQGHVVCFMFRWCLEDLGLKGKVPVVQDRYIEGRYNVVRSGIVSNCVKIIVLARLLSSGWCVPSIGRVWGGIRN